MELNSTFFYLINHIHEQKVDSEKLLAGNELNFDSFFSPSSQTLNTILNFAKSYDVILTKGAGFVEMNKN